MSRERPLESLSDDELLRGLADLLGQSRRVESSLVAHVAEVETRRLYARHASPSMFVYCTDVLHLSEAEAYLRITAARAAREHPVLLEMLAEGRIHLTGIAKLAPHLTRENRNTLLPRAVHKTKRQIEELIAEFFPQPDVPGVMRKLPAKATLAPRADVPVELGLDGVPGPATQPRPVAVLPRVPAPPPVVQPLSPARYKFEFTAGAELYDDLEQVRALLRSKVPDGDLATIFGQAVREMRQRLVARRFAPDERSAKEAGSEQSPLLTAHPGRGSTCCSSARRGPMLLRRPARKKMPGTSPTRVPPPVSGLGGNHDPHNICLMCPAHNRYIAELDYGREAVTRRRRSTPETMTGPMLTGDRSG